MGDDMLVALVLFLFMASVILNAWFTFQMFKAHECRHEALEKVQLYLAESIEALEEEKKDDVPGP